MILKVILAIIALTLFISTSALGQSDGVKPQFWNNFALNWSINEKLSQGNEISYNFLIDKDLPWSELAYYGTIEYEIYPFMQAISGLYLASTNQKKTIRTNELRPFLGVRLVTNGERRFSVGNLTRIEWRNLHYEEEGWDSSFRLRNRTTGVVSLTKKSILENQSLAIFGYFEGYFNFNNVVVERFFTNLKYKVGFAYKFSSQWRINLGAIFQESKSTLSVPSNQPTDLVTNVVVEAGVTYRIPYQQ